MKVFHLRKLLFISLFLLIIFRHGPCFCADPDIVLSSSSTNKVRFAVIGDYGSAGPRESAVAEMVKSMEPHFVITTGDNNYCCGEASAIDNNIGQYYHEFISPYKGNYGKGATENRFFPSIGNHDWQKEEAAPYLDYFSLPNNERYYTFTYGPLQLFALNSNNPEPDGTSSDSVQAQWLKSQLASSQKKYKFVYMHHPPYSSGMHGSNRRLQWPFKEWGVDAVFSGHDHTYERIVIDDMLYFVNGLGGASIYKFVTIVSGSLFRYNKNHGAMLIEVDENKVDFKLYNINHELIDSYTLLK